MLRVVERDIGGAIARHLEQHPEASDRAVLVHLDPDSGTFTTTPQRVNSTTDRTCARAAARPRPTLNLARTRASN